MSTFVPTNFLIIYPKPQGSQKSYEAANGSKWMNNPTNFIDEFQLSSFTDIKLTANLRQIESFINFL